ncbi:MAG: hypothetical protein U5L75_03035 [Candidatus Campbellbacteria bacterium]|nr:hypothetical protein [Candidatus Campbellbacteria bacterium]
MKKKLFLLLASLAVLVISACEVSVSVDGGFSGFVLREASYVTDYSYRGESIVCDDRTTRFEYDIAYFGSIDRVEVYLLGEDSGRRKSISSFSPSTRENEEGRISGSFSLRSEIAPLRGALSQEVSGEASESRSNLQSIVVLPKDPEIIGYTRLYLELDTESGREILNSRAIEVFNFCG